MFWGIGPPIILIFIPGTFCCILSQIATIMNTFITVTLAILGLQSSTNAFLSPSLRNAQSSSTILREGRIERIEFKIHPDGRIEEKVIGIKGGECHKVTEEINQSLGKVVASRPTEEMYEQEIVIEQTVQVKNNQDSSAGGSGWEGASSW